MKPRLQLLCGGVYSEWSLKIKFVLIYVLHRKWAKANEYEKIINRIIFLLTKSENGSHRPEHHTRVNKNKLKNSNIVKYYYNLKQLFSILFSNLFLWCRAEFSASLLQSSMSHDPQKSSLINVENSCAASYFQGNGDKLPEIKRDSKDIYVIKDFCFE